MRTITVTKLGYNEVIIGVVAIDDNLLKWVIKFDDDITEYILHRNVGGATVGISTMRKVGIKTDVTVLGHAFINVSEQLKRNKPLKDSAYIAGIRLMKGID